MKAVLVALLKLQELEQRLAETEARLRAAAPGPAWEQRALAEDRAELLEELLAVRASVPRPVLADYDRARRVRADPVARVVGGACGGCHRLLPSARAREVLRGRSLVQCEHCRRLLAWPEAWRLQP